VRALPDLSVRSELQELMDDHTIGGNELTRALHELRWINRLLGAAWPTLEGVAYLWRQAGRPEQLTLLDVGAGSGDANALLLRWAAWRNIDLRIVLVDIQLETCAAAAELYKDEPRIHILCADLLDLAPRSTDIVTASLVVHHFPAAELPAVFGAMRRAARIGVVVNDLQRHLVAWASIWTATRLFSRSRMIQHDAPLSVRRGFRRADVDALRATPGLGDLRCSWRPFFRYLMVASNCTVEPEALTR